MSKRWLLLIAATSMLVLLVAAHVGRAQEFYSGQRITIIVSYFPGGGNDLDTRLIARHLPKHVPGSPRIIVQNMPGAGTVIGANYLYRLAPRDGTAVGIFGPMQVVRQVIGLPGVEFHSENFNWLVGNVGDVLVCVATPASGVKNLDDAIKRREPLIVAATGPGSLTFTWPRAYKEIFGANFKIVSGYRGAAGIRAALERREVDAACISWRSFMRRASKEMLDAGAPVAVFTQIGTKEAPDLPHVENALKRVETKMDRQVLTALLTEYSMSRPYVAPPGVPGDRVQLLRKAFMDTLRDPRLLEEARRMDVDFDPVAGEEVQNIVTDLKKLPREAMEKIRNIMEQP